MDFSNNTSLIQLGEALASVRDAAEARGCSIFLTGALARDIWLSLGFGIDTGRRTEDADFAVQCEDWDAWRDLVDALVDQGLERVPGVQHKFRHANGQELDLIPYGGVELPDRTVAWPPDENPVMNLLGFSEVAEDTTTAIFPGNVEVPVISLRALGLLKLLAWEDRGQGIRHKDATDLYLIGRTYLDTRLPKIELERATELLESNELTDSLAGAELLGSEMAAVSSDDVRRVVVRILNREADRDGPLGLARAIDLYDSDDAVAFIVALKTGYGD